MIESRGLTKRFGSVQVLSDVTATVPAGICGLLGSNGAGKTTLISILLGIEARHAGSLEVLGVDPATAGPEVRARIGYSPEHHHLPDDVQAADLVQHMAQLHGLGTAASFERASDALWLVGLGEERFRPIGTMSTGQRQRVKLAAAIAHDPELVLLDEPTDGLDPMQRDAMLALIHRIGNEYGISVVLSSHVLEEVERICDHVVIIGDGTVIAQGNIAEMRGGRGGVAVELEGDPARVEAVVSALVAAGAGVERDELNAAGIVVDAPAQVADPFWAHDRIRDLVAESGLGLRSMVDRTQSLEDVFLTHAAHAAQVAARAAAP